MLFSIGDITNNSCVLNLSWENLKVGFEISAYTNELATVILKESVKKADGSFSVYNKAATYLLENDGDKKEALDLAIKSTSQQKKFWNLTVLAEAYAANGDAKMAVKTAKEALIMSEDAKYTSYIERNKANLKKWGK
jgi:predicted Zn-dependent protease